MDNEPKTKDRLHSRRQASVVCGSRACRGGSRFTCV